MASAAISLALLAVALVAVPLRLWASRMAGSMRRPPRTEIRRARAPDGLGPGLRRLVRLGRELVAAIERIGPVTGEYRRTLPYVSLFFSDGHLSTGRDRWIRETREGFEQSVSDVAIRLRRWQDALFSLRAREYGSLVAAGVRPDRVLALLDDGTRLPKTYREARRFRFCEDWEVDRLIEDLEAIADDLRALDAAVCSTGAGPYRSLVG